VEDNFVCLSIGRDFEVGEHLFQAKSRVFQEEAQWILTQLLVNPSQICGLLVQVQFLVLIDPFQNCGSFFDPLNATWFIPIPGKKPPVQADYPNSTVSLLSKERP